jgi:diguanylate cyclase (GGDEF)-like protein
MRNTLFRSVLPICLISAMILFLHSTGFLVAIHNGLSAYRFASAKRPPTGEIAIVDVDTKSIREVGVWPWPRSRYAILFDELKAAGATDIAFDIDVSTISTPAEDATFEQALIRASGSIILPVFSQKLTARRDEIRLHQNVPIERFERSALTGTVNVPLDPDGRVRAYGFGTLVDGMPIPSFAAALAGLNGSVEGTFLIDFSIDGHQINRFSAIDILNDQIADLHLRGKRIIIGSSAEELRDYFWVPGQGLVPGPVLHALATETILQDRMLEQLGSGITVFGMILLGVLVFFLTRRLNWVQFLAAIGMLAVAVELFAVKLFQSTPLLLDTSAWHAAALAYASFAIIREIDVQQIILMMVRNESRNTQTVLDHVIADNNDGVFVVEETGEIVAVSRAGLEILRLDPHEDYSEKPVSDLLPDILCEAIFDVIAGNKHGKAPESEPREIELVLDNEDVIILDYVVTPSRLEGDLNVDGASAPDRYIACLTLRDITIQRQMERRLQYLATHDPLTGLANRTEFEGRLLDATEDEAMTSTGCSVISIDLDRFKNVNDTLGHEYGDQLLRLVASRLLNFASSTNVIAGFGGDEFAILLFEKMTKPKLGKFVREIIDSLSEPYEIYGHTAIIGASAGVVIAKGGSVRGLELIRAADVALYGAKANGGNGFCFFEPQMGLKLQLRRSLELDLRQAMDRDEFEIYYQPQTRLPGGRIIGVEALIRWLHPERGFVSPMEFIPVAEDVGLIEPIGAWLLKKACAEVASWPQQITLAVNLSAVQFTSGDLLKTVSQALAQSGLPPEQLEFEITESLLMKETGTTIEILGKLRDMNSSIAMDDFGTGYSSLSYIQKYPIDKIKIDRAFVMDLPENQESLAIIDAISAMAKSLGLKTTAEGIETREQAKILAKAGCTFAQGYLYGKPMPAEEIVKMLPPKRALKRSA